MASSCFAVSHARVSRLASRNKTLLCISKRLARPSNKAITGQVFRHGRRCDSRVVVDRCLIEAQPLLALIVWVIVKLALGVVQMEAIARGINVTVEVAAVS
jgi:hypothetical protein